MLSEELKDKIDNKVQEYIDINTDNLLLSDLDLINDVKNMIVEVLEKSNIVELPCKVGDTIYDVINWDNSGDGIHCVVDLVVVEILIDVSGVFIKAENIYLKLKDYNKTWFTDRELAEKKLEELNNEKINN